jgi:hypothetical protein
MDDIHNSSSFSHETTEPRTAESNSGLQAQTLTTFFAATSGCFSPRQILAAFSELRASQTPSEAMMSLPPPAESCSTNYTQSHIRPETYTFTNEGKATATIPVRVPIPVKGTYQLYISSGM